MLSMREPYEAAIAIAPAGTPVESLHPSARWDLLLVCLATYIATAVGRVHQLFPVLAPLKPTLVSAVVAVGLLALQQQGLQRLQRAVGHDHLRSRLPAVGGALGARGAE